MNRIRALGQATGVIAVATVPVALVAVVMGLMVRIFLWAAGI